VIDMPNQFLSEKILYFVIITRTDKTSASKKYVDQNKLKGEMGSALIWVPFSSETFL
jgi:hypothetical protein